jgi:hypothetical protein
MRTAARTAVEIIEHAWRDRRRVNICNSSCCGLSTTKTARTGGAGAEQGQSCDCAGTEPGSRTKPARHWAMERKHVGCQGVRCQATASVRPYLKESYKTHRPFSWPRWFSVFWPLAAGLVVGGHMTRGRTAVNCRAEDRDAKMRVSLSFKVCRAGSWLIPFPSNWMPS